MERLTKRYVDDFGQKQSSHVERHTLKVRMDMLQLTDWQLTKKQKNMDY